MKLSVQVLLVLVATLQNASSQCSTGSVWLDGSKLSSSKGTGSEWLDGSILSSSKGTQVAGLLMVCRDGVWGTVQTVSATHLWSEKNALVVCRSLGFEGALNIIPATQVHRVSASVPVLYESVACTGVEERLIDCPGTASLENEFNHVADVYLVCWPGSHDYNDLHTVSGSITSRYGDVRLVGDVVNGQGAVELYTNIGWSTVCPDSSWTDADADIICQRLGYDSGTARTYSLSASNSTTVSSLLLRDSQCATRRQASSIFHIDGGYCSFSSVDISNPCADKGYAGVSCRTTSKELSVRLFGLDSLSSSRFVGVVEYQLGGRWGVVCSPSTYNSQVPRIICGEVGYRQDITSFKTLESTTIQSFESRQKPAWILDFTCDSSDRRFSECGVVAPIGYGKCRGLGDILTVDCGPRRRPLTSGQVAGIVVPCVLLFLAIVLLFIFREKWVPQAKVFVQRCLKCQQFKGWKANMARSMARRREARRRRQAERRAARQAAREAREAEREARVAEREAREAAREAAASGFQNDCRMMQPTPYFYPPEEAPPPYAD